MYRGDDDELVTCRDCGATIELGRDRGYRLGPAEVLCFECVLSHGGVRDEPTDAWIVPPEVTETVVVSGP